MARVSRPPLRVALTVSGKHVVFGEVVEGMDVIKAVEKVGSKDGKVASDKKSVIMKCGTVA